MKFNSLTIILKVMGEELLTYLKLFYGNTGRLPLTNGLMIVPDGEVPEREKKINLKSLYKIF